MRKTWLPAGAAVLVLVLAVLAYAWIDGGLRPLRQITQVVPVPATAPQAAGETRK